jgi:hypothetical protein
MLRQYSSTAHQLYCLQGLTGQQQPLQALCGYGGTAGQGQPDQGTEGQVDQPSISQGLRDRTRQRQERMLCQGYLL